MVALLVSLAILIAVTSWTATQVIERVRQTT